MNVRLHNSEIEEEIEQMRAKFEEQKEPAETKP
jgi:hypothetical protein